MKIQLSVIAAAAALFVAVTLAQPLTPRAQMSPAMKDDMEQLVMDIHVGVDRSTLTPEQKAQLKDDVRELRTAHQNHQMFAELRAARSIRTALDSGAFRPEDQQRIKQDMQALKGAREPGMGGGMM
jgi:Spy/CpxP family protein refolding chaperone